MRSVYSEKSQELLLAILCAELTGVELSDKQKSELTEGILPELFKLADRHSLAHIVADYVIGQGVVKSEKVLEKLKQNQIKEVFHKAFFYI